MRQRLPPGSGTVTDLGGGRFRLRFVTQDGKRRSRNIRAADADAARAVLDAILTGLADQRLVPVGGMSLRQWGEEWLARRRADGMRGVDAYEGKWRTRILSAPFVDRPLSALNTIEIRTWFRDLPRQRVLYRNSARTISVRGATHILRVLSSMLADAVEIGHLASNPAAGIRVRDPQKGRKTWDVLRAEEIAAIERANGLRDEDRDRILFALGTGLRAGEQCALHLADVHAEGPQPRIVVRHGSPRGPTKTGETRAVYLFGPALEATRRQVERVGSAANPHALLFPDLDGEWISNKNLTTWLQPRLVGAGIRRAGRFRWHWLRHTYATAAICGWWGEHWPLEIVAQQLGHSATYMTTTYAHLMPDAAVETVARTQEAIAAKVSAKVPSRAVGTKSLENKAVRGVERETWSSSEVAAKLLNFLEFERDRVGEDPGFGPSRVLRDAREWIMRIANGEGVSPEQWRSLAVAVLTDETVRIALQILASDDHLDRRGIELARLLLQKTRVAEAARKASES